MTRSSMTRRRFVAGAAGACAFVALGLSGCGGAASPEPEIDEDGGEDTPSQPEADEPRPPLVLAAAIAGGTAHMDSLTEVSPTEVAIGWHVHEGLYDLDRRTFKPYPALAAGDPEMSDDGGGCIVRLREGARFSDGTPVLAADVAASFEKYREAGTCKAALAFIEAVAAVDDAAVGFAFSQPIGDLLMHRLALVKIVPADFLDAEPAEPASLLPIGSGPWKLAVTADSPEEPSADEPEGGSLATAPLPDRDDFSIDEVIAASPAIRFERNEHYSGPAPAPCEEMTWYVMEDALLRSIALAEGRVLAVEGASGTGGDLLAQAGLNREQVPGNEAVYVVFNTKSNVFKDRRARMAALFAIDVDRHIAEHYGRGARIATCFLPESHAGYHRAATTYSLDAERARSLLDKVKLDAPAIRLSTLGSKAALLASAVADDLDAVGFSVTRAADDEMAPAGEAAEQAISDGGATEEEAAADLMLVSGDVSLLAGDPDFLMSWWFEEGTWMSERTCWEGSKALGRVRGLLAQARADADEAERRNLWEQCFDLLAEEAVIYPLFHCSTATAWSDDLGNFTPLSTAGLLFLETELSGEAG